MRGDSSSLGDPQGRGPVWRPGGLEAEACGSPAGECRWGDESLLISECLWVSAGRLPASLLGDHGLLGDTALELRAEAVSFSRGPEGAGPSRGRHRTLWLDAGQLLAAQPSASKPELPRVAWLPEVASGGRGPRAGEESAGRVAGGPGGVASEAGPGGSSWLSSSSSSSSSSRSESESESSRSENWCSATVSEPSRPSESWNGSSLVPGVGRGRHRRPWGHCQPYATVLYARVLVCKPGLTVMSVAQDWGEGGGRGRDGNAL